MFFSIVFTSFAYRGDALHSQASELASGKSAKVVGVSVTITNNTAHTLTFTYNGITSGNVVVNANSAYNGKITAQPGTVYTITLSESPYSFYYLDNAGNNGGPVSSISYSVTLNNGYTVTAN